MSAVSSVTDRERGHLVRVTLKRSPIVEHTHFIPEPRNVPVVLSPEELKASDIDSKR